MPDMWTELSKRSWSQHLCDGLTMCVQVAYEAQRAVYVDVHARILAWHSAGPPRPLSPPATTATATGSRAPGSLAAAAAAASGDAATAAQAGGGDTAAKASKLGGKSARASRRGLGGRASEASALSECPLTLPDIGEPIPAPASTRTLRTKLAQLTTKAPWATPAAQAAVAAAVMTEPAAAYVPAPRPPLAEPPATPPPEPLPLNGYLWSALGKTAFVSDGLDLSPDKLKELERAAAAQAVNGTS